MRDANGPLDWNCDGDTNETDMSSSINNDRTLRRLTGYDDWRDLWFKSGATGLAGVTPDLPSATANETLTPAVAASLPEIGLDYRLTGFAAPVDNLPTVNVAKAGSAIPVKFGRGGDRTLDIVAFGSPQSRQVDCVSGQPLDDIETTASPGSSGLSYDVSSQRYTYVWKTDRAWLGTCRMLTVALKDGTLHHAAFKLK
ncbi:PxKF domain-containing protein [Lentzea sp. NPDC005914]|uniref:PxKF domain-containing protein n=1 Tax=Lentzea sp. NPDC005914 TaxID=3154572 RepID=UPI0033E93C32